MCVEHFFATNLLPCYTNKSKSTAQSCHTALGLLMKVGFHQTGSRWRLKLLLRKGDRSMMLKPTQSLSADFAHIKQQPLLPTKIHYALKENKIQLVK